MKKTELMVRNISIDQFYTDYADHVQLISSSFRKPIDKIIRICRLKPFNVVFAPKDKDNVKFFYKWIDEYGNSLNISRKKKITITLNDLSIKKEKLSCTDIYEKLSINKISKISKLLYFLDGKEEDLLSKHNVLAFLGLDGYLRVRVFIYGEWKIFPPLYLGFETLLWIAENFNASIIKNNNDLNHVIFPCDAQEVWLGYWRNEEFLEIIKQNNEDVFELIK